MLASARMYVCYYHCYVVALLSSRRSNCFYLLLYVVELPLSSLDLPSWPYVHLEAFQLEVVPGGGSLVEVVEPFLLEVGMAVKNHKHIVITTYIGKFYDFFSQYAYFP